MTFFGRAEPLKDCEWPTVVMLSLAYIFAYDQDTSLRNPCTLNSLNFSFGVKPYFDILPSYGPTQFAWAVGRPLNFYREERQLRRLTGRVSEILFKCTNTPSHSPHVYVSSMHRRYTFFLIFFLLDSNFLPSSCYSLSFIDLSQNPALLLLVLGLFCHCSATAPLPFSDCCTIAPRAYCSASIARLTCFFLNKALWLLLFTFFYSFFPPTQNATPSVANHVTTLLLNDLFSPVSCHYKPSVDVPRISCLISNSNLFKHPQTCVYQRQGFPWTYSAAEKHFKLSQSYCNILKVKVRLTPSAIIKTPQRTPRV